MAAVLTHLLVHKGQVFLELVLAIKLLVTKLTFDALVAHVRVIDVTLEFDLDKETFLAVFAFKRCQSLVDLGSVFGQLVLVLKAGLARLALKLYKIFSLGRMESVQVSRKLFFSWQVFFANETLEG